MAGKDELRKIVGSEKFSDDSETLEKYRGHKSLAPLGKPSCVVRPDNTEMVQMVVRWANEAHEPLIPLSSPDGPRMRGDTIPAQGGVILDLSSMNKIHSIDERDRVAGIEPGVTFGQLSVELRKKNLKVLKPLLPRRGKSVLASYLEREPITIPKNHWDAHDPLNCTEIVFGSGDVFRTGSASGPGTIKEQYQGGVRHVNASGPGTASISRLIQGAQGTMGIVTWGSVSCGLLPEIEKCYLLTSDDLDPLIEVSYQLLKRRIGEELFILNGFHLATILANNREAIQKLFAALPTWIMVLNLTAKGYFPEEKMEYQETDLQSVSGAVNVSPQRSINEINGSTILGLLENPPEAHYKLNFKGGCQEIIFMSTLNKVPAFVSKVRQSLYDNQYPDQNVGIYIQPTNQGCSCHCEFCVMYDPESQEERTKTKELVFKTSKILLSSGAFFSRPYWPCGDLVYRRDAATYSMLQKMKDIFDPNRILNPGKLCF